MSIGIINITYMINEQTMNGIDPGAKVVGKGIKVIKCNSQEECMNQINEFIKSNNIQKIEENCGNKSKSSSI